MTLTIPPLRPGVTLETLEDNNRLPYAVADHELGQRVRLGAPGMALAKALNRSWDPGELLEHLASSEELRMAPQLLVQFVRFLDSHYLLDTPRAHHRIASLAPSNVDDSATPADIQFLPGTQHACIACGASCEGHDIGPINPDRVNAIKAVMSDAPFLYRRTGDPATTGHYCAMTDDRCQFLTENRLCSIHATAGLEPKPTDCRVFPLAFTHTPTGTVVGVRLECRSYIASKRSGGALSERQEELRELVTRLNDCSTVSDVVRLDDGTTLPFTEYAQFESQILSWMQGIDAPVVWDVLLKLNSKVRDFISEARSQDHSGWVFPPEPVGPTGVDANELLQEIIETGEMATRLNRAAGNTLRAGHHEVITDAMGRLLDGPLSRPEGGAALSDDDNEMLLDHLSQSIFLKDALQGPHLRYGWALLNLSVLLAMAAVDKTEHLNAALTDSLKLLRTAPVQACLERRHAAVAEWFHDNLEKWVAC